MGKISKVHYKEIEEDICSLKEASEFYFYYNLSGTSGSINEDSIKYEELQMKVKNSILGEAYRNKEIPSPPKMSTCILGISNLKGKPVLITEY